MVEAVGALLGAAMAVMTLAQDEAPPDEAKPAPPSGEINVGSPPPRADVAVPAMVQVHNEMGKRYRLAEVAVLLDAVEVARVKAPKGAELGRDFPAFAGPVPPGEHAVTVTLIYDGRNPGPITYFDDYHFRVESTTGFKVSGDGDAPAKLDVVARERKGMNVPFDKKVELEIAPAPGSSAVPVLKAQPRVP
jgi:hypothetical protein